MQKRKDLEKQAAENKKKAFAMEGEKSFTSSRKPK